jgi:hypothetical protein
VVSRVEISSESFACIGVVEESTACLIRMDVSLIYLDDGGSRFLQSASSFLPDFMVSHARRW